MVAFDATSLKKSHLPILLSGLGASFFLLSGLGTSHFLCQNALLSDFLWLAPCHSEFYSGLTTLSKIITIIVVAKIYLPLTLRLTLCQAHDFIYFIQTMLYGEYYHSLHFTD